MTKMPEPATYIEHDGVRENLYTADQLKQYGRDLLEEAAKKCETFDPRPGKWSDQDEFVEQIIIHKCVAAIRAMKENI